MQLEYKDCDIRPATGPAEARRNLAEWQRKQAAERLRRKAAAGDDLARRMLDLHYRLWPAVGGMETKG